VELARYTRELYAGLEIETGHATGFRRVGLLQIAANKGVLEDLRRKASFNKHMGIESEEICPTEVRDKWPLARTDDILAGFFFKNDGRANPVDVPISLSKGAKARGVRIYEGVEVTGVTQENDVLTGGGVGRLVANWIVYGLPDMDVTGLNTDRFQRTDATRSFRKHRRVEILGEMYKVHFPGKGYRSARDVKRHVLYNRLASAGALYVRYIF